jgi:hypothetical protein
MPSIKKCIEDVEMAQLDIKHVLPNTGDSSQRGIWFPLGYNSGEEEKETKGDAEKAPG